MDCIPYGTQCIEEDDIEAVTSVLRGGFLTTGPNVEAFENALCGVTGAKYAVAVSSGTSALHLAAMSLGLKSGDEAIVSPLTFAASSNCVLYCGATPVFADVDPDTLLMDLDGVQRKITDRTRAIVAVHYGGECCDMEALSHIAEKHGIALIQDAAHALGSKSCGKPPGGFAGLQTWSFHPVKTITTGEGGAVTTNDEGLFKSLLRLRTHGITRDHRQFVHENEGDWHYEQLGLGYNYRITDLQCALGVSQLKKLERFARRRAEIVSMYDEAFEGLPIETQKTPQHSSPVRHLYTIRVKNRAGRKGVFDFLHGKNIGVNVHYIPVYLHPYYEKLGYPKGLCPVAEDAYSRLVTIPLYPAMTDEQVLFVIECVKEAVKEVCL